MTGVAAELYVKSRIFRELETIESYREVLGRHIYEYAKKQGHTRDQLVFYDLFSRNFSGLRCVMAKWGHCKDGYKIYENARKKHEGLEDYWLAVSLQKVNLVEELLRMVMLITTQELKDFFNDKAKKVN